MKYNTATVCVWRVVMLNYLLTWNGFFIHLLLTSLFLTEQEVSLLSMLQSAEIIISMVKVCSLECNSRMFENNGAN
jgi:hypothetical protein